MSTPQGAPAKARFLVHAVTDGDPVRAFLDEAAADPDIAVVDTIGPRGQPHTVVVEISPDKALALAQRFRNSSPPTNQLTIEPDRPLSMFDSGPAGAM
ncbi:MAG: hypothetical protein V4754_07370 [Pseudomonadota bacterium]